MGININKRRLELIAWLHTNQPTEFYSALKLQKFVFLYESFSNLLDLEYDFDYLKAYANGPVFSDLYGDYTYRKDELMVCIERFTNEDINEEIAIKAGFLVKILSEEELSEFTHELDAWKVNEGQIGRYTQVSMKESQFTDEDFRLLADLLDMYSVEFIESVQVVSIGSKNFILSNSDMERLEANHNNVLMNLSDQESLINPVYVHLDENGVLLVD